MRLSVIQPRRRRHRASRQNEERDQTRDRGQYRALANVPRKHRMPPTEKWLNQGKASSVDRIMCQRG
jgi:hypothetical protein